MKKGKIVFIIVAAVLYIQCSTSHKTLCLWQDKKYVADGKAEDWPDSLLFNNDMQMLYAITNDQRNLYINLRFFDKEIQRKIMTTGLTIWIDTTAGGKEQLGIKYPVGNKPGERPMMENGMEPQRPMKAPNNKQMNDDFQTKFIQMELTGFNEEGVSEIVYCMETRIKISMRFDSTQALNYEAMIPLYLINHMVDVFDNPISIGFKTGGMKRPGRIDGPGGGPGGMGGTDDGMGGNMGGPQRGGGGGAPSGGMQRSGGRPDLNPNNDKMQGETAFWIKKIWLVKSK